MRYERKFIVEKNISKIIPNFLLENKFIEEYPTRNINSIYYDSLDFVSFLESEEGFSDRSKLRIRFYDDPKKLFLENKIKNSDIGQKLVNSLDKFSKEQLFNFYFKNCDNVAYSVSVPKKLYYQIPSLFVCYKRDYFKNLNDNIRITIDYKLGFGKVRNGSSLIHSPLNFNCDFSVLEVKYASNNENLYVLDKIIDLFSLTLTRCSKYCYGINTCY